MNAILLLALIAGLIATFLAILLLFRRIVTNHMTDNTLEEIKALRQDLEAIYGVKFSREHFTQDDAFAFFLAVENSLHRFDRESKTRNTSPHDLITEAKGYVAILQLILSWAEANKHEGVKWKATELLQHAESTYKKMRQL